MKFSNLSDAERKKYFCSEKKSFFLFGKLCDCLKKRFTLAERTIADFDNEKINNRTDESENRNCSLLRLLRNQIIKILMLKVNIDKYRK